MSLMLTALGVEAPRSTEHESPLPVADKKAYVVTLCRCPVCGNAAWGPCAEDPTTWHCLPCAGVVAAPRAEVSALTPTPLPPGQRCPEGTHVPYPPDPGMPGIRQCQRCPHLWREEEKAYDASL
jgi:hypothetical protein